MQFLLSQFEYIWSMVKIGLEASVFIIPFYAFEILDWNDKKWLKVDLKFKHMIFLTQNYIHFGWYYHSTIYRIYQNLQMRSIQSKLHAVYYYHSLQIGNKVSKKKLLQQFRCQSSICKRHTSGYICGLSYSPFCFIIKSVIIQIISLLIHF